MSNILSVTIFYILINTVIDTGIGYMLILPPAVFVVSLLVLLITYIERRDRARRQVIYTIDEMIFDWKLQAIEQTIANIHSIDPVTLEKIQSYADSLLNEKFVTEYPSLNLFKLRIVYPDTQQILLKLLDQQPFLGTYYQVEQHFVKHFEDEKK